MALDKFVNIQFAPALKRNELRRLKIPGPVPDPEELFFLKEGTVGVLALLLLLLPLFKSV